jgi:hypothetical protein
MSSTRENILHWLERITESNPFNASLEVAAEVSNNPQLLDIILEDFQGLSNNIKVVLLFSIPCLRKKAYDEAIKATADKVTMIRLKKHFWDVNRGTS